MKMTPPAPSGPEWQDFVTFRHDVTPRPLHKVAAQQGPWMTYAKCRTSGYVWTRFLDPSKAAGSPLCLTCYPQTGERHD
jgi:hypothetical protein